MGSEDLFHKRKARGVAKLQREKHEREQNKRYLIVCEGTKTEPYYLGELLSDLRIRPQMVRIAPNEGVTPDRVVARLKTQPGFAKYGKGQKGTYWRLKDQLTRALTHAQRLRQHGLATGSTNPATDVDALVQSIRSLAKK